jgi:hypothetical protein
MDVGLHIVLLLEKMVIPLNVKQMSVVINVQVMILIILAFAVEVVLISPLADQTGTASILLATVLVLYHHHKLVTTVQVVQSTIPTLTVMV